MDLSRDKIKQLEAGLARMKNNLFDLEGNLMPQYQAEHVRWLRSRAKQHLALGQRDVAEIYEAIADELEALREQVKEINHASDS